jgi:hypothetical protein
VLLVISFYSSSWCSWRARPSPTAADCTQNGQRSTVCLPMPSFVLRPLQPPHPTGSMYKDQRSKIMSTEARGSVWVRCHCCQVSSIFLEAKTGPHPAPNKKLDWQGKGALRRPVSPLRPYSTCPTSDLVFRLVQRPTPAWQPQHPTKCTTAQQPTQQRTNVFK